MTIPTMGRVASRTGLVRIQYRVTFSVRALADLPRVLTTINRYMMPGEWLDVDGLRVDWSTDQPGRLGGEAGVRMAVNTAVNGHPGDDHPCRVEEAP